ncbi:maleate cis-trans isomerase [Haladaptatus sp. W1]|uniref:maleate cis-trans isomerase family protein n=1 Tax=Haladaptatus sp. W1 TaxID=1897478 RepID=UPI000849A32F|nr:aspartate/glutamate racemase family protein [Haladaptatus sp. W1]ODR80113.1 maleate cis-trans isomerase [Haladaptatus sp. W1]
MFGWRARLGLVVPSSNTTVETEFGRGVPDGVSVHTARMPLESVTVDELDTMADDAVDCAERLSHADVDVVAYACTTGSLLHGPGFDTELEASLSETADVPAVATALSVKRALSALDADRIAVVTPYTDELNDREESYLRDEGFDVVKLRGRGIKANTAIGSLSPEDAYRQVRGAVPDPDAVDAVFVSCTNYRTFPAIESLESDLGMPVVTSNQATLWDALRRVGIRSTVPGAIGAD